MVLQSGSPAPSSCAASAGVDEPTRARPPRADEQHRLERRPPRLAGAALLRAMGRGGRPTPKSTRRFASGGAGEHSAARRDPGRLAGDHREADPWLDTLTTRAAPGAADQAGQAARPSATCSSGRSTTTGSIPARTWRSARCSATSACRSSSGPSTTRHRTARKAEPGTPFRRDRAAFRPAAVGIVWAMDIETIAALVFAGASAIVIGFQLALALGAPWGAYTMGGTNPGRLPTPLRVGAFVQAIVIGLLAIAVLSDAGLIVPSLASALPWLVWVAVAFSAISTVLNAITRSAVERRTWLPVASVMLVSSLVVALVRVSRRRLESRERRAGAAHRPGRSARASGRCCC